MRFKHGKFVKYHIQKDQLVKVPEKHLDDFGTGDVYIVDTQKIIYVWIGKKSTPDEKFIGAISSVWRDQDRKGSAKIETIYEREEPKDFLDLFGGKIEITEQDTAGILTRVALKEHDFRLFRVHIDEDLNFYYEVPRSRESLTTDDVYILDTYNKIFIWRGRESTSFERWEAMHIAEGYDAERAGRQQIIILEEDEETDEFLEALK